MALKNRRNEMKKVAHAMKINSVSYRNVIRKAMKDEYESTPVVYKMTICKDKEGNLVVSNMVADEITGQPRFQYGVIGNSKAIRRLTPSNFKTRGKVAVEEEKDLDIVNFKVELSPTGRYKFYDSIVMVTFGEGVASKLLTNGFKVSKDGLVTVNNNTDTDKVYSGEGFEFGAPVWGPTNEKHNNAFFYNVGQRSRDEWYKFSDELTGGAFEYTFKLSLEVQKLLKAVTRWGNYMTGSIDGPVIDLRKDYIVVIYGEQGAIADFEEAPKGMDPGTNIQDGGATTNAALWQQFFVSKGMLISEEDCCKLSPQVRFDVINDKVMDNIEDDASMKYREAAVRKLYGEKLNIKTYGNTDGKCMLIVDTDGAKLINEERLLNACELKSVVMAFAKTNSTSTSTQLMDKYTKKNPDKAREILTKLYAEALEGQLTEKVEGYFDPDANFADNMLSLMGTDALNYKEVATKVTEDMFKYGVKAISKLKVKMDSMYSHAKFDNTFVKTVGRYGYTLYVKYLPGYDNYAVEAFNVDILEEKAAEIEEIENDPNLSEKERELKLDALLTCITIKYPSAGPEEYEAVRYLTWKELRARIEDMELEDAVRLELEKYWNRASYGITYYAPINILKNKLAGMDIDFDATASDFSEFKSILLTDKARTVDFILYQKDLDKLNIIK